MVKRTWQRPARYAGIGSNRGDKLGQLETKADLEWQAYQFLVGILVVSTAGEAHAPTHRHRFMRLGQSKILGHTSVYAERQEILLEKSKKDAEKKILAADNLTRCLTTYSCRIFPA